MPSRAIGVLILLPVLACATVSQAPAAAPAGPGAPAASASPAQAQRPPEGAPLPDNIRWVRDSAEYQALTLQAYAVATAHVEAEAPRRSPGTWAVILDADDTVINNVPYQIGLFRDGVRHTQERFTAWTRERASTPVPGAARFLTRVRTLGGRIAIVTNRIAIECPDTEAVFRKYGLVFDVMLCRTDPASSDKNPRFRAVAEGRTTLGARPLDVIAWLGDNIHDFPGASQSLRQAGETAHAEFGDRWFVFPNPMYGSWQ
jgi:5'-nucleotidase (lipoprotein e(P4) family)